MTKGETYNRFKESLGRVAADLFFENYVANEERIQLVLENTEKMINQKNFDTNPETNRSFTSEIRRSKIAKVVEYFKVIHIYKGSEGEVLKTYFEVGFEKGKVAFTPIYKI